MGHAPGKPCSYANIRRFVLCVMGLACVLITLSCGRKALPTPVATLPPPVVSDLQAHVEGNNLKLTWSVPEWKTEDGDRLAGFRVYRSEESGVEPVCEDCPRRFELAAELAIEKTTSDGGVLYTETVTETFRYFYQVSCYSNDGIEGDRSKTVAIHP